MYRRVIIGLLLSGTAFHASAQNNKNLGRLRAFTDSILQNEVSKRIGPLGAGEMFHVLKCIKFETGKIKDQNENSTI